MKSIANYISILRIVLAISMFLIKPLSIDFYFVYCVCGLSDFLDGYIARKTNTQSKLGEKLDSIADIIMFTVVAIIIYPILNLTTQIISWVFVIVVIRIASIMVVLIKYKTFEVLHTYSNKITGLVLFILPFSIKWFQSNALIYVLCVISSISAIEELIIHLSSNNLECDKKSIVINK